MIMCLDIELVEVNAFCSFNDVLYVDVKVMTGGFFSFLSEYLFEYWLPHAIPDP